MTRPADASPGHAVRKAVTGFCRWGIALAFLWVIAGAVLHFLSEGRIEDSDLAHLFNADSLFWPAWLDDMFLTGGNPGDWQAPPTWNFFPDLPLWLLAMAVSGELLFRIMTVALLQVALLFAAVFCLARSLRSPAPLATSAVAVALAVRLGLDSGAPYITVFQSMHHYGAFLGMLFSLALLFVFFSGETAGKRWGTLALLSLLAWLLTRSDPLYLLQFLVPMVATGACLLVVSLLRGRRRQAPAPPAVVPSGASLTDERGGFAPLAVVPSGAGLTDERSGFAPLAAVPSGAGRTDERGGFAPPATVPSGAGRTDERDGFAPPAASPPFGRATRGQLLAVIVLPLATTLALNLLVTGKPSTNAGLYTSATSFLTDLRWEHFATGKMDIRKDHGWYNFNNIIPGYFIKFFYLSAIFAFVANILLRKFSFRKIIYGTDIFIIVFSFFSIALTAVAVVLSYYYMTTTYFIHFFMFPFILTPLFLSMRLRPAVFSVLALAGIMIPAWGVMPKPGGISSPLRHSLYPSEIACLDESARKYGLRHGIADYWDVKPVRLLTRADLFPVQYQNSPEGPVPYLWITSEAHLRRTYDFALIAVNGEALFGWTYPPARLDEGAIRRVAGPPLAEVDCGKRKVLVYGKDGLKPGR